MSVGLCAVEDCDRPVQDAAVCGACAGRLERDLGDVPALADELELVLTRQTVYGDRSGSRGAEQPLPYDVRASEVGWVLRNTLVGWCRIVHTERGDRLPADELAGMARWLLGRVEWLRHHQAGGEAVSEVCAAVQGAWRAVDRPPASYYAGPCDCGEDLTVRPGAAIVTCRACGRQYDVPERRAWLLAAAEDRLATAAEIARAVTAFGDTTVTGSMVRNYANRGRLLAHGVDWRGRPMYRIGDLLDLLAQAEKRSA